jgi:O-antigen/teichoic acid export membrane protein
MCLNQVILSALLGLVLGKSLTKKFSILEAKGQISFGIPIAFTSVSYFLMVSMDRFVINEYLTSKDVGLYSLAIVIGSAINILFVMPFGQIWSPMRM